MQRRFSIILMLAMAIFILAFTSVSEQPRILRSDTKIVLVVDAAHGGEDMGSKFEGYVEKDINLKIARRISSIAAAHNIEVHLTRSDDTNPALDDRVTFSDQLHPEFFISLHVDDDTAQVKEPYRALVTKNKMFSVSWQLGASVLQQLLLSSSSMDANDLIMKTQGLHILRKNTAPAILIDLGNIRDKEQMQLLTDDTKTDEVCHAILNGVVAARQ